jgi:hypothetical protein
MCNVDVFRLVRNDNHLKLTKIRGIIYHNLKVLKLNNHARMEANQNRKVQSTIYTTNFLIGWLK